MCRGEVKPAEGEYPAPSLGARDTPTEATTTSPSAREDGRRSGHERPASDRYRWPAPSIWSQSSYRWAGRISGYGDTTDVLHILVGPFVYFMAAMIALTGLVHVFKILWPGKARAVQATT